MPKYIMPGAWASDREERAGGRDGGRDRAKLKLDRSVNCAH
jgi:hypothetical protein